MFAAMAFVLMGTGKANAPTAVPAAPSTQSSQCAKLVTASQFRKFADAVWSQQRWRRGDPPRRITIMKHRMLECVARPAHARQYWDTRERGYFHYRAYKLTWGNCSDAGPVPDCIHGAAVTYHADEGWMLRVSYCESTWNRFAVNPSGSTGLFQFMYPSTWKTTPFGDKSIWSAKWQSLAAAWMESRGQQGAWVCQ